ncbi:hypothetical protein [Methylobacterium sp. E-045]|uniref:hypothetical protein n=1 Tax=Methylobacterium sp. E-045 TaxID=2836575 RepID=UPI001FB9C84B|nr:hypothetical protein [Methylobacterium sp. E-045]MCJ2127996.1 hypothetical protein [Methylobacterium sp. E-045]
MEQRHCVDRTPVSEAQTFVAAALIDRDIDAAATKLLTTPSRSYDPLPEPGSPEAVAMFNAACGETDRLMLSARDGYPELRRVDGSSWTKRCLHKARDAGTIGVVEYARLYLLAAEREHRMDAASLATRVSALHALAYPDQFGAQPDATLPSEPTEPAQKGFGKTLPTRPDFTDYAFKDLFRTFDAFNASAESMALTTHATSESGKGDCLLDDEADRLWHLCNFIAEELKSRQPNNRSDFIGRASVIIRCAISRGDFEEAVEYANDAYGRGL